jgi:hypothetical protein
MKTKFLFLFGIISLCCVSCKDDEENSIGNYTPPGLEGLLLDGGRISDVELYCIENKQSIFGLTPSEYYSLVKTMPDYTSFHLMVQLNEDKWTYYSDNYKEMHSIIEIEFRNYKEESLFIYEEYEKYNQPVQKAAWPEFFTAYLNGEVTITCDKALFGEQPGTNLSSHFTITALSGCLPVGIENPKLLYHFGDEMPKLMSDYFVDQSWLQYNYYLWLDDAPSEKYEELTFHLTIPMIVENSRLMAAAEYKGTEFNNRYTEAVFDTDCKIKFNWEE